MVPPHSIKPVALYSSRDFAIDTTYVFYNVIVKIANWNAKSKDFS